MVRKPDLCLPDLRNPAQLRLAHHGRLYARVHERGPGLACDDLDALVAQTKVRMPQLRDRRTIEVDLEVPAHVAAMRSRSRVEKHPRQPRGHRVRATAIVVR